MGDQTIFQEGHITCHLPAHPVMEDGSVSSASTGMIMKRWWTCGDDYIILDFHDRKYSIHISDFKQALANLLVKTTADLGDGK